MFWHWLLLSPSLLALLPKRGVHPVCLSWGGREYRDGKKKPVLLVSSSHLTLQIVPIMGVFVE